MIILEVLNHIVHMSDHLPRRVHSCDVLHTLFEADIRTVACLGKL